jgi:hypothetical protein
LFLTGLLVVGKMAGKLEIKVMNQEKQYIKEMLQYADELFGIRVLEVRDDA